MLKQYKAILSLVIDYIKWGFESRLKHNSMICAVDRIISNGDLKVG